MRDTFVVATHHIGTISNSWRFVHKIVMPQRDDPRHNLRFPPDLKAKLAHSAIDNGRSMNAEILARLERSFTPDPSLQIAEAVRLLGSLTEADRAKLGTLLQEVGALFSPAQK